jgi:hypothetical protein
MLGPQKNGGFLGEGGFAMNLWTKKKKRRKQTKRLREERLKQRRMAERYDTIEYCLQELRWHHAIQHTLSEELIRRRKIGSYIV